MSLSAILLIPLIILLIYFNASGSKYKNSFNGYAFFFDNNNLVLNMGTPYPIPLIEIDHVELTYAAWRIKRGMTYGLAVKVVKKDGKAKKVSYNGYGAAAPADMAAALESRGIRCVLNAR